MEIDGLEVCFTAKHDYFLLVRVELGIQHISANFTSSHTLQVSELTAEERHHHSLTNTGFLSWSRASLGSKPVH